MLMRESEVESGSDYGRIPCSLELPLARGADFLEDGVVAASD